MDPSILEKIETLFSPYRLVACKKGKVILQNFDPVSHIFYLQKGLVRQYAITNDGEEVTIHFFKPPSFFPIMLALSQGENRYTFIAATNAVIRKAPVEAVLSFIKKEPEVLFDLATRFAKGLSGLTLRIEHLSSENVYKRVVSLLLYLAVNFGSSSRIDLPLTHQEIASLIGSKRETVSRQMEKLKRKRLIDYKGKTVFVKNLKKLEKELLRSSKKD